MTTLLLNDDNSCTIEPNGAQLEHVKIGTANHINRNKHCAQLSENLGCTAVCATTRKLSGGSRLGQTLSQRRYNILKT